MQTPEVDDFEILIINHGRACLYDFPTLTIWAGTSNYGYLNVKAGELSDAEGSESFAFARNSESFFISFLPPLSEVKGYKLRKSEINNRICKVFSTRSLVTKFNVAKGHYRIKTDESIFKKDLTWYPLEFIEDDKDLKPSIA